MDRDTEYEVTSRRDSWLARAMHRHGATSQQIASATGFSRSTQYNLFKRKLPKRIRQAVFERDGRSCKICGFDDGPTFIDHIYPKSLGGTNDLENLQVLCLSCNSTKGKRVLP